MTPTWARPFAPPEEKAIPRRGREGSLTVAGIAPMPRIPARKGFGKWKEVAMILLRYPATGNQFRSGGSSVFPAGGRSFEKEAHVRVSISNSVGNLGSDAGGVSPGWGVYLIVIWWVVKIYAL